MTRFLVTGANGFVGRALCAELLGQGYAVRAAMRNVADFDVPGCEIVSIPDIAADTVWTEALRNVDVVVHLAARVHVMRDEATDPLKEFRKVNALGTENLARQAAAEKVRRLVFVSSIGVNGLLTEINRPFTEADTPDPRNAYVLSKWEAEQSLRTIAGATGLEIVIVRPPLTYGPGVKGNFLGLLGYLYKDIPMPFAGVRNARSLLYLGNMLDILLLCSTHPAAAGKTYLIRDGEDISMPQLVRVLREGMGHEARLFYLPLSLLRSIAIATGKQGLFDRLTGSLRIDDTAIRKEIGWIPKFTLQQGLQASAKWYKEQRQPTSEPALPKRACTADAAPGVSVVIVNYNAGEILCECVAQALQQAEQVIVVDNASDDGSVTLLRKSHPSVIVVSNKHNLGFAKACNQGARIADGKQILFLNPDCLLEANAVQRLVHALQSARDVGMVGGLLTNPDGSEQGGARRAVPTPWRSLVRVSGLSVLSARYPRLFSDFALHKQPLPEMEVEVEAISGACMLVKREALEQVGLLDEGYFMHCEDLDWCMRFRREGWKLLFVPDARMVHHKGHCSKSRPIFVEWNKHKGMVRFYKKFFRHQYPGLLMLVVSTGVWARFSLLAGYYSLDRILRRLGLKRG